VTAREFPPGSPTEAVTAPSPTEPSPPAPPTPPAAPAAGWVVRATAA